MKLIHLHVGMVQTNCYVFYDENTMEGAVVDPGDNAAAILREISRAGADIKYILLTHGHFDHILAVHEISEKTGAKLVTRTMNVCFPMMKWVNSARLRTVISRRRSISSRKRAQKSKLVG